MNVQATKVHFLSGSAHKFHGPKGIGFVYINGNNAIKPLIEGGAQERNMRAGTENVVGIVGLGKALELWMMEGEQYRTHIESIRDYMAERLLEEIPSIVFNGYTDNRSLYHVLSVSVPANQKTELLLFNLDISGICASGASACASGSIQASHVLEAIKADENRRTVRFSFSKNNTKAEVDFAVAKLKEMV
jgi:cysteine desulfurase